METPWPHWDSLEEFFLAPKALDDLHVTKNSIPYITVANLDIYRVEW